MKSEWQEETDLHTLLETASSFASDRKLRLFALACCRRDSSFLTSPQRDAINILEKYADRQVGNTQRRSCALSLNSPNAFVVQLCSSVSMTKRFEHLGGSVAWVVADRAARRVANQLIPSDLPRDGSPQDMKTVEKIVNGSDRKAISR